MTGINSYLIVVLAVLTSRVWTTLVGPFEFSAYVLYLGHVGLWLIFFLGPILMLKGAKGVPQPKGADVAFLVGVGWTTDQFLFLILREDPQQSYWGLPSLLGTIILTGAVLVTLWLLSWRQGVVAERHPGDIVISRLDLSWRILFWSIVGLLAWFRLSSVIGVLLKVSNEEVSLFILGYEIHHICWGTLAIIGAGLLFLRSLPTRKGLRNVSLLMSVGLGITADELLYYMERTMTLESYVALPSLLGALGAGVGVLLLGWLVRRSLYKS